MDAANKSDIQRLARERAALAALEAAQAPAPILARTALGSASASATAGIASPLTEPSAATRQYHPNQIVTTTDGVLTFVFRQVSRIDYVDANGRPVVMQPADAYA